MSPIKPCVPCAYPCAFQNAFLDVFADRFPLGFMQSYPIVCCGNSMRFRHARSLMRSPSVAWPAFYYPRKREFLERFPSIFCIYDVGSIVCSLCVSCVMSFVLSSLVKPVCNTFYLRTLTYLIMPKPIPFRSLPWRSDVDFACSVDGLSLFSLPSGVRNPVFYTMSSWKDSL